MDRPNEQLRTIILPPDPMPVLNARVENFFIDDTALMDTNAGIQLITQDGHPIMTQGGDNIEGAQNSSVTQLVTQIPLTQPV